MARRSLATSGNSAGWRARILSYRKARMPRASAMGASWGSAIASNTNVDALVSSMKYSSSDLGELRGKGTATPPARQMPHCTATQGNPGARRNATRCSRRSSWPASSSVATRDGGIEQIAVGEGTPANRRPRCVRRAARLEPSAEGDWCGLSHADLTSSLPGCPLVVGTEQWVIIGYVGASEISTCRPLLR